MLMNQTDKDKGLLSKQEAIIEIISGIKQKGFTISSLDAIDFIENFKKKFDRFPTKEEIEPIIKGYVISQKNKEVENKEININGENPPTNEIKPLPKILHETPAGLITISKPIGRRTCPNCGNSSTYKIHEIIDKDIILCNFPRVYGKKYSCDGCRCEWREE